MSNSRPYSSSANLFRLCRKRPSTVQQRTSAVTAFHACCALPRAGPLPAPSSTSTATRKRALRRAARHGGLTPPVPGPGSPGSSTGRGLVGGVARRSKPRSTPFETAPWASLPGRSVSRSGRHPAASSGRAAGVRCVVAGCLAGPGRCIQQGGNCLSAKPRAQTIFNGSAPPPQAAGEDPNGRWPRPQSSAKKPTGLQTFGMVEQGFTSVCAANFAGKQQLACPA